MILVIDTSSFRSVVGIVESGRGRILEETSQRPDLVRLYRDELADKHLTKVAVAVGPGSFTGLRVGVSFSLGLAIGLRVPIFTLRTLHIQAARSDDAVIAVAEAGRGRVYLLAPGAAPRLAEPADLPRDLPSV